MVTGPGNGPDRREDPKQPISAGAGTPIDYPLEAFLALRDVLMKPSPLPGEISLCASHFCNAAIPALVRGTLSPDQALEYLSVRHPNTNRLLFQQEKLLEPLLCAISKAVTSTVSRPGEYTGFISRRALDALCSYVAHVDGIDVETRLKVYDALVAGSTKTIQFGKPRLNSEEVIDRLASDLRSRAQSHPSEVAAVLIGIGKTVTNVLLAKSVDSLLKSLSPAANVQIPAEVQAAALEAMKCRVEIAANRGKDGRMPGTLTKATVSMILQDALGNTMHPVIFRAAAENIKSLLMVEVAAMCGSYEGLAHSDFTQGKSYGSGTQQLKAAISRTNVMFPAVEDRDDVGEILTEALGFAQQVERGTTAMSLIHIIEARAPAFVTKGVARLAYQFFKAAAPD